MIYLTQTDTTVGLLSKNKEELNKIKKRELNKPILKEVDSLSILKEFVRVPKNFRKIVRRAKKTTFIYPNKDSFRVVKDENHLRFLKKFKWMYSTSANLHKQKFDKNWAFNVADVIVGSEFKEGKASTIIKIGKRKCKKLR
jgi:tRNA A37 threonylcarbamoyladenosine synthetase subunit TsaC/SUA5/YrdC